MKTKGYVTFVKGSQFKGKTLWSFRISTDDRYFGCGTLEPKVAKDDFIEFEYEEKNGYCNVNVNSIAIVKRDASEASPAPSGSGRPASGRDQYWVDKEQRDISNEGYRKANDLRIQYQSARNAAISVVDILTREKSLKVPEKNQVEVILAKIEDLTNQFYEASSKLGAQQQEVSN